MSEYGSATHDLEFDRLSLQLDSPNLDINTNDRDIALRINAVSESKEQSRLFRKHQRAVLTEKKWRREVIVGGWLRVRTFPTPESPMRSLKR